MGKDWDKAVPPVAVWRECLRVLKHGSFAFVMSSPRADILSRMIVNLQDAGFRTDFTPIYWAYASGFPKAMNISKAVDKKLGVKREVVGSLGSRPIQTGGRRNTQDSANGSFEREDNTLTVAVSQEAKLLDGGFGGFQPKPAVEVIICAMKPLSEKTYVDQALKNGKGVTWLDEARIPFAQNGDKWNKAGYAHKTQGYAASSYNVDYSRENMTNDRGRFPANLLVSDDCLNDGTLHKSGDLLPHYNLSADSDGYQVKNVYGDRKRQIENYVGDEGSFSRYFSLDAWFIDRIKRLPLEVQRTFPFLIEPKASKGERNKNLERLQPKEVFRAGHGNKENDEVTKRFRTQMKNNHPTVKPLALMSYLITLGSRPNDLIIDPFCGSGTTCLAAKMLGRQYVGIELNAEYVVIAEKRVGNHKTLFEFAPPEQVRQLIGERQ